MDEALEQILGWLPQLLAGGIATLLLTRYFERTTERRKLYATAFKTVLSWQEMLYRVRRRAPGDEEERKLIAKFHDLQEELNYYQGIMSSESKAMGKSYRKFVNDVKRENVQLIQEAWEQPVRKPKDGTPKDEKHPDINKIAEDFLRDTRNWLAWWQIPKLFVIKRNRK